MKYPGPQERILYPALISLSQETAHLLQSMANDMGVSLDELLSGIAEDSVSGLQAIDVDLETYIPKSCSRNQLEQLLENS